ncbi:MAG: DUF3794 and LysM peptidoglycan-binding domain-containing protein [Dethiobacteraceae bacterium]|jgi:LysM repeat protein
MIKETNKINRIIAPIRDCQEAKVRLPLEISLPGEVEEFNDPEITVLEAQAKALSEGIFLELIIQQDTFYVVKETGLVNKATTVHQLNRLVPAAGSQPGLMVQLTVEPQFEGRWSAKSSTEQAEKLTVLSGSCRLDVAFQLLAEEDLVIEPGETLAAKTDSGSIKIETVHADFMKTFDLALPVALTETACSEIHSSAKFINQRATAMCGWVKVEGELAAAVAYQLANGTVKKETFVFPVREYLPQPTAQMDMEAVVSGTAEILTCQLTNVGAVLRGLLHVKGKLLVQQGVAADLRGFTGQSYASGHYHQPVDIEVIVGVGSSQTLIEQEIFFGRKVKLVREPVAAEVRHLQYEIIHNKVIVRGILDKELFVVDANKSTVFLHNVKERFVHFVDVPGAAPGMRAHVQARVEYVRVEINPDQETARQVAIIEIRVKVFRRIKQPHQPPFKPPYDPSPMPKPPHDPPSPPPPPQRIYIVRSGDSVWKIAQMFGVPMEAIIAANNLQNPNLIYPGQKLIIPL